MTQKNAPRAALNTLENQFASTAAEARRFGHVVSVSGPQAIVVLEGTRDEVPLDSRMQIGALVKIPTPLSWVISTSFP